MSTYLELCADVARESGAIATAPTSVESQTGRQNKSVQWVMRAWEAIQRSKADWLFMRKEFEGTLVAGTKRYTGAALGITDLSRWVTDTPGHRAMSIYPVGTPADEMTLRFIPYEQWRRSYNFGVHDQARPTRYAISPANEVVVGATPDASYKLRGEYIRTPQILEANNDTPIMPERFHQAIVWKAIMMMSQHDEAWPAYNAAQSNYDGFRVDMERDLLPTITTGGNTIGR